MSNNLNKKELAEALYNSIKEGKEDIVLTKSLAAKIVDSIFNPEKGVIASHLCSATENKVTIPSFGTFSTRKREAREGRHPAWDSSRWNADLEAKYPGGKLEIPESYVVTFKAGKGLKKNAADNLK